MSDEVQATLNRLDKAVEGLRKHWDSGGAMHCLLRPAINLLLQDTEPEQARVLLHAVVDFYIDGARRWGEGDTAVWTIPEEQFG